MKKMYSSGLPFSFFKKHSIAILVFVLSANLSLGQVIAWTDPGTATGWYTAANWAPNMLPGAWVIADVAQFNNSGTAITAGIDMGISSLSLGGIEVTGPRSNPLTIGNSSVTAGTLTLNGGTVNAIPNVILRNASANLLTLQDNETGTGNTMNIALANTTDNIINIDGTGGISISSVISGGSSNKLTLSGLGSGTLQLTAANTYTGLTTVSATTLQLNNTGGGTLPAGNDVTINSGGTLKITSNQTLNNLTLAAGATLTVDLGVTLTINGTFFHNGGTINGTGTIAYGPGSGPTIEYGASFAQTSSDTDFPVVNGPANVTVNNANGVTLHAIRTISNTLHLTNGNFILGVNNFTAAMVTGAYSTNTHVYTNSTGELIINAVGLSPVIFPIGTANTYNPVAIYNGNNVDFGARVDTGINPAIGNGYQAVNRTWLVKAFTNPAAPVNIDFTYSLGDQNPGFALAPALVELGIYNGSAWNVPLAGLLQNGTNPYTVQTTVSFFNPGFELPMVIGNIGAILPIHNAVEIIAQKQNNNANLNWTVNATTAIRQIEIERSADGRNFTTLATVGSTVNNFTDDKLLGGTNYYRIKITDVNGKITYSSIVAVLNKDAGFDMVNLLPNIVNSSAVLNITSAQKTKLNVVITDISGRRVLQDTYTLIAGSNQFSINISGLSAGTYHITGYTTEGVSKTLRFVKQ